MQQDKQHKSIYMQICLKLAKEYRRTPKPETGTKITYNIQDLKLHPEKLKKCLELQTQHFEYDNNKTTQQNWTLIEKTIHTALQNTYPYKKKHNKKKTTIGSQNKKSGVRQQNNKQWNTTYQKEETYNPD